MSLATVALGSWALLRADSIKAAAASGPSESFLLIFSSKMMLAAFSGNFSPAIRIYSITTILAAGLALALVLRTQRNQAALLLGLSLSGMALFAAYFILGRHVPFLTNGRLLGALDYAGMAIFALGIHAMVQIALCYPRSINEEDYLEYKRRKEIKRQSRSVIPTFAKLLPTFFRRKPGAMNKKSEFFGTPGTILWFQLRIVRSSWWPWGLAAFCCGLVALSQFAAPGLGLRLAGFILLLGIVAQLYALTCEFLGWQYRLGVSEERNQVIWSFLGVFLLGMAVGASSMASFLSLLCELLGREMAWRAVLGTLLPPLAAIMALLFLGGSIFFFGAIDPRMAIRKTSVYGIAALLLTVALAAAQSTAVVQIVGQIGLPGHSGSIVAGAAVALVFAPMRKKIEAKVERAVDRVLPANALAEARRENVTVMFGDLSGYTDLSAKDELKALTLASLLHKESRRLAERHGGRLVKTIGDAVLMAFAEPGEAVVACLELREKFAVAANALNLPALPLHFGLHFGEVVRDQDGDIFGGTVNLAARLQGVAHANEIVISETVASAVARGNFTLQALGAKTLKNVPAPVNCFLVA